MTSAPAIRLYVTDTLVAGAVVTLEEKQAHYLLHVRRCREGATVGLFNGRDGEWLGELVEIGKKRALFHVKQFLRAQSPEPDVWLAFAPLKHGPIDFLAEKATELGVSRLQPVMTKRTIVTRINQERLLANAVEAAEQCERLSVPEVAEAVTLPSLLGHWPQDRLLIFADESGGGKPVFDALAEVARQRPLAVLIGPEGGFTEEERTLIAGVPQAVPVGLGPRVMRADTAAIAALACVQAAAGDWQGMPAFRQVGE